MKTTQFERAIFISWYCSKRDCAFCYLSSRKHVKQDPKKDRRSLASIFAEAIICKACKWKVEFLSGGCDTFTDEELLFIIKTVYEITKQKQWLNVGVLNEKQMKLFKPYTEGICGTVECITPKLRDRLCPSKPLKEIEEMFKLVDKVGLKKAITIIIGLGETLEDFKEFKKFIKRLNPKNSNGLRNSKNFQSKHSIDRVTFYRLKPQKDTIFENKKGPKTEDYVEWVKRTRKEFPDIEIITGSWLTHLDEIHLLLNAGSDAITKFPSIRKFNTKYAKKIEKEAKKANRKFIGTLTKPPKINITKELNQLKINNQLKNNVKISLNKYLKRMKNN